jgi:hypothetical protein
VSVADEIARQLRDELSGIVAPVLGMIDPRLELDVEHRIRSAAPMLAAQLLRLSAQTCIDVMCALWPHGAPEQVGRADWWQTPLGRACARVLAAHDRQLVTHAQAAAMLGVKRGTVGSLVARGRLTRAGGRVARASVLARLAGRPA